MVNNLAGSGKLMYLLANFPNDSSLERAVLPGVVNSSSHPREQEGQITVKERDNS